MITVFILLLSTDRIKEPRVGEWKGKQGFLQGKRRLMGALRGTQPSPSSLVSLLDIRLCILYSALIRGLIHLSPRMFLFYLGMANFRQAKCSN